MIRRAWKRIKIIYHWLPVIWNDEDWDYAYTLDALKHKLIRQRECFRNSSILVKRDKGRITGKLSICINLLNRLDVNDYYFNTGEFHPYNTTAWAKHSNYMEDQDFTYLMNIMSKQMRGWWD